MFSINRAVIAIFNLPEREPVKEAIGKALLELPCLAIRPDWVFFQFPTSSGFEDGGIVVQVFVEAMERNEIDFLFTLSLSKW